MSPMYRPSSPLNSLPPSALRSTTSLRQKPPTHNPNHMHTASHASNQRSNNRNLHLPGLPRFHPANYISQDPYSSITATSGLDSPQPPLSPRQQHRNVSEAQQYLHHPRELAAYTHGNNINTHRGGSSSPTLSESGLRTSSRPTSPRLNPLGSPGPVTPLELEAGGGYLSARPLPILGLVPKTDKGKREGHLTLRAPPK